MALNRAYMALRARLQPERKIDGSVWSYKSFRAFLGTEGSQRENFFYIRCAISCSTNALLTPSRQLSLEKSYSRKTVFFSTPKNTKNTPRARPSARRANRIIFPNAPGPNQGERLYFMQIGRVVRSKLDLECVWTTFFSYIWNQPPSASAGFIEED